MANIIPVRLPSGVSVGEKDTFALLQNLDDDHIVYHNPTIKHKQPDFVVIMRDSILVIEVKGIYKKDILDANPKHIIINKDGKNETITHPLEQARKYKFELLNHLKETDRINNKMLNEKGELKVPIHHMVILSNITKEQANEMLHVFTPDTTLYRDELKELISADVSSEKLLEVLKRFMQADHLSWGKKLEEDEKKYLKALIHPEIVLEYTTDDIKMLDERQMEVAMKLGGGHRLIKGVAGSGKTIILETKAKLLAGNPENKILFTCFNRPLADNIKEKLKGYPKIEVMSFHQLIWKNHNKLDPKDPNFDEKIKKLEPKQFEKYDAIFVDETQDFKPEWLELLLKYHKEPLDGDLFLAGDNAQSLYYDGRDPISVSDIDIHIVGRTQILKLSYRNTKQIMEIANKIAYDKSKGYFKILGEDYDLKKNEIIYEYKTNGENVNIIKTDDIVKSTNEYLSSQPNTESPKILLFFDNNSIIGDKTTYKRSKGLQWEHIVVVVDSFDTLKDKDGYLASLYVAITRSMAKLTIIVNEDNSKEFLSLIEK